MVDYGLGWKRQEYDARDFKFESSRLVTDNLPRSVNLSQNMGPLLNQGNLGSCGPNTAAEQISYDQKVQLLAVETPSRLFIYWVTRLLMNTVNQDSGVDNRNMFKAMAKYGFPPEKMWPYIESNFKIRPTAECFTYALRNRIVNYAAVATDPLQMKGCLSRGFPFCLGMDVYKELMSDRVAETGDVPTPLPGQTPVGGHDVTIFGYDDDRQCYLFRNHWFRALNVPWGRNGCGTLPYSYAHNVSLCTDFWVLNGIPGTVPPLPDPTPTPTPIPTPTPLPIQKFITLEGFGASDGKYPIGNKVN